MPRIRFFFPAMLVAAAGAHAQTTDAPAAPAFTANVALTSQYVSRGFRQTWGHPAIQGGVDWTHPGGWSAGTWISSVSDKFIEGGTVEWDLYAGYTRAVGDVSLGAQVYYYRYPGAKLQYSHTNYDYGEIVASLGYKWFGAKYWLTYTPDYFGYNSSSLGIGQDLHSRGSGYLDLNGTFDVAEGTTLLVHYGQERVRNFAAYSFRDARIALSKAFAGGWAVTGALTRGWGRTDVYDRYTTGALDSGGRPAISNPLRSTLLVALARTF